MQRTMQEIQLKNEELQHVVNQQQFLAKKQQDPRQQYCLGPEGSEDFNQSAEINLSSIVMLNQNSSHEGLDSALRSEREACSGS